MTGSERKPLIILANICFNEKTQSNHNLQHLLSRPWAAPAPRVRLPVPDDRIRWLVPPRPLDPSVGVHGRDFQMTSCREKKLVEDELLGNRYHPRSMFYLDLHNARCNRSSSHAKSGKAHSQEVLEPLEVLKAEIANENTIGNLPTPSKAFALVAFMYLQASKKHPLEVLGVSHLEASLSTAQASNLQSTHFSTRSSTQLTADHSAANSTSYSTTTAAPSHAQATGDPNLRPQNRWYMENNLLNINCIPSSGLIVDFHHIVVFSHLPSSPCLIRPASQRSFRRGASSSFRNSS